MTGPPSAPHPFVPEHTVLIANPAAAGGGVGRGWTALETRLRSALGPVEIQRTARPGHASELAAQAVRAGRREILSLGGDGTHNEVVGGIMAARPAPGEVTLGILPAGTGGDFRRLLQDSMSLEAALAALPGARVDPIDLGLCRYTADDGHPGERWFLNIASCGISGLVCRHVNASSKRLGGTLTFYLATLRALTGYRAAPVRVRLDGRDLGVHAITSLQACNGRFAGGGMMFAPQARLDDGLLDLVILRDPGLLRTVAMTGDIYKGTHLRHAHVEAHQGRHILVEPQDPDLPAWVDIDGEAPGRAPVEFELVPTPIRLRGARPEVLRAQSAQ